jgi:hypothetical protein
MRKPGTAELQNEIQKNVVVELRGCFVPPEKAAEKLRAFLLIAF